MDKSDFYKILCSSTPEEINHFISSKGKIKNVNAITFLDDQTLQDLSLLYLQKWWNGRHARFRI